MTTTNKVLAKRLEAFGIAAEFDEEQNAFFCAVEFAGQLFDVAFLVDVNGYNVGMRTLELCQVMELQRPTYLQFMSEQNRDTKLIKCYLSKTNELVVQMDLFVGPRALTQELFDMTVSVFLELLVYFKQELKVIEMATMTPIVRA